MQVQRTLIAFLLSATVTGVAMAKPLVVRGGYAQAAAAQSTTAVDQGYQQLKQGLAEQAIATFTRVLRTNANDIKAQLGLAMAQQKAGRTAKAIIEYEKTLRLDPANRDAMRELGRLYSYQEVTWVPAIDILQKYATIEPGDAESRLLLGNLLSWRGEHPAAEQAARAVLQLQPNSNEAKTLLAQALTWQGRGKEAMPLFSELLNAGRLVRSARGAYALALRQSGNYSEAEKLYNQLIAEQPNDKKLKSELADLINERANAGQTALSAGSYTKEQQLSLEQARVLHQQKRTSDAISLYRRVLAQRPGDAKLMLEFIDILASDAAYRNEAIMLVEREFQKAPSRQLQLARAKILSWMPERRMEALGIYREYYRQNPLDEDIRKQLTQVLIWADTDTALIGLYNEMLQLDPNNEQLRLRLAQALLQQKDFPAAIAHMETLLRANPDNFDARLGLAGGYLGAGRVEDAEAQMRLLLQLDPRNVDVLAGLAGIAAKAGDYEKAAQMFSRVLRAEPNHTLALVGMANALLGEGRPLEAINYLKKAYDQTRDEKIGLQLIEVYQKLRQYDKAEALLRQVQPRNSDYHEAAPARNNTVPPPTTYRRVNEAPEPPAEPVAAETTTSAPAPVASEAARPRRSTSPAPATPQKTNSSTSAKPAQPLPADALPAPVEPTIVAAKPVTKLKPMFLQDPDDIRSQIEDATAPTLTFAYEAVSRSGEEAVAFAGSPDAISYDAMLTNRLRISYDFNLGRQFRVGLDILPTFLSTPTARFLGNNEALPGSTGIGKDGAGGRVRFAFQPNERVRIGGNGGVTLVGDAVGGIDAQLQLNDKVQLQLEASRDAIAESVLSYAGYSPLGGGGEIGRVRSTGGGGGLGIRFDPRTDATFKYRRDRINALGLPDNDRNLAEISIGRDISDNFGNWKASGLDYFRVGYQFTYFGFQNDQSTIVTNGGDFFGELLVRGYYSPKSFLSNGGRVDVAGTYKNKLVYRVAGGIGLQVSRSIASRFNQPGTTTGSTAYINLMYRFTDRFSWGAEYEHSNAGSNYTSNRLGTTVVYKF